MHKAFPPLNALRAFEAAARRLSLTKAAAELNVTPGALSHQIRGLEDHFGAKLFERGVRSIALTNLGRQLYPGLQAGFVHIREAVENIAFATDARVLVVSTPPGFTSKWLAPRLYRFSQAHPDLDVRISSTMQIADFRTDGVDIAIRNLTKDAPTDPHLLVEKLIDQSFIPVCSPDFARRFGPFSALANMARAPLIHDETFAGRTDMSNWADWFAAAGVVRKDVNRGLRFNSADHALDATVEGAGLLLAHAVLAYDDLRTGRLVVAHDLTIRSPRAYCVVCPKQRQDAPNLRAFRGWIRREIDALDWRKAGVVKNTASGGGKARSARARRS
ncbi:MAG: transcriptional regulator GcvA [Hyphomicrobiales bacterium]|nr:transcriptional regulator GcvA [Hyphomicrobiales bacterium]